MSTCVKLSTQLLHYGIVIAVLDEQCSARRQYNTSSIDNEALGTVLVGDSREDGRRLEEPNCLQTTESLFYSSSIAYILHTSGSTGVPKKVSQRKKLLGVCLVNLCYFKYHLHVKRVYACAVLISKLARRIIVQYTIVCCLSGVCSSLLYCQ